MSAFDDPDLLRGLELVCECWWAGSGTERIRVSVYWFGSEDSRGGVVVRGGLFVIRDGCGNTITGHDRRDLGGCSILILRFGGR